MNVNKTNALKIIISFISLDVKKTLRSTYFRKTLPFKLLFLLLFFFVSSLFILFGSKLYFTIETVFKKEPLSIINGVLIYWFFFDLVLRYFLQKPPFLRVLPLMTLPIKRKIITHYYLIKTLTSKLNLIHLFIIIPFSFTLLYKGVNFINILGWFTTLTFITFFTNFLNLLIKKSKIGFFCTCILLISILLLEYFGVFHTSIYSEKIFNFILKKPISGFTVILLPIIVYSINYKLILNNFYIDNHAYKKNNAISLKLNWINNLNNISPFLKNDLKLILRNSKPKQYALISLTFLLYGITVFKLKQIATEFPTMLVFISILITGGFLFSFGQLIPSWDSSYYKMLMCQGISYRNYLQSKLNILSLSVLMFFILSLPYIVFGITILKIIFISAIFNVGITVPLTLLTGSLNRKSIALNTNIQAFETNEFNSIQVFMVFIKLALPILIFYPMYKIFNFEVGLFFLGFVGIIGYIFRNYSLHFIEKAYKKQKYNVIKSFSEKE